MNIEKSNPSSRHPIAALYLRSVLDPIVEAARAISHDFVARPRHYRAVPESLAAILAGFRTRTGSHPEWPSAPQRAAIFAPLFGTAFRTTSADLRCAARALAERSVESNSDALEDLVRNAAVALRGCLKAIEGRTLSSADGETGPTFQSAVDVLRNTEVASRFGLPSAPGGHWPMDGALETDAAFADGAFLVEEVQRALSMRWSITQDQFVTLQRVGYYGALTIAGVLGDSADWNKPEWAHALARSACSWDAALRSPLFFADRKEKNLGPRVISPHNIDDEELKSMPTEEGARSYGAYVAMMGGNEGGGGLNVTCNVGWTRICDQPHSASTQNHSCTYGQTFYCDTGPTCTSGWTLQCDKWAVGGVRWGLDATVSVARGSPQ